MPLLGAHMSIAGGFVKGADAAIEHGMQTVQIFTSSPQMWIVSADAAAPGDWRAKPLRSEEVEAFASAVTNGGLRIPCAHSSYLINLASGNAELWGRSVAAFTVELERASALGLAGVVIHPGSAVDLGEDEAIRRIAQALDECLMRTSRWPIEIWLETTAGQGTSIGHRFEQIGRILSLLKDSSRVGVCVDTCHIFAAGYPLATADEYGATFEAFDAAIGVGRIRAFHLNDSKKDLGSRVDRHEHIGEGKLGLEPFRNVLNDPRFATLPMYLETPKGERDGRTLDAINLETLRSLLRKPGPASGRKASLKKA